MSNLETKNEAVSHRLISPALGIGIGLGQAGLTGLFLCQESASGTILNETFLILSQQALWTCEIFLLGCYASPGTHFISTCRGPKAEAVSMGEGCVVNSN